MSKINQWGFSVNSHNTVVKGLDEIEKYREINSDLVKDILDQAAKINQEIVHPLAKIGDETYLIINIFK